MMVMGHGGNTVTRMPEAAKGIEKLDLLVVGRSASRPPGRCCRERKNGHLSAADLHAATRSSGSRTASNRSLQWGEQIVKPIFESKDDYEVMYLLAKKLGFADKMFKNIKVENNVPVAEDILREINRGGWSTGYCGQSPERLKLHMANQKDFDLVTLRAPRTGPAKGDYYGLPWPCWGTPEFKHPGTPHALQHQPAREGWRRHLPRPLRRRARGQAAGRQQVARTTCSPKAPTRSDSEIKDGYPEFTYGVLKKLGWDKDLTDAERAVIERIGGDNADAVSWSIDLSGGIQRVAMKHGCIHYGNGKARANAFGPAGPDPGAPRADLHAAARSGRQIPDAAERAAVPHAQHRLRRAEGGGGEGHRQSSSRSSSPPAAWSNTKAAARRRAPTSGSPNCSRTCSSRSIPPMPPSAASRTAAGSG